MAFWILRFLREWHALCHYFCKVRMYLQAPVCHGYFCNAALIKSDIVVDIYRAVIDGISGFGTDFALRFVSIFMKFETRVDFKRSFRLPHFHRAFCCAFIANLEICWAYYFNKEPSVSTGFHLQWLSPK